MMAFPFLCIDFLIIFGSFIFSFEYLAVSPSAKNRILILFFF